MFVIPIGTNDIVTTSCLGAKDGVSKRESSTLRYVRAVLCTMMGPPGGMISVCPMELKFANERIPIGA
jgi:hypothetical protein